MANRTRTQGNLADLDPQSAEAYEALRVKLVGAKTTGDLYKAVDADFKAEVARLPEIAQRALRDMFAVMLDELRGKVKVEEIVGIPLTITIPPDFPDPKEFKQKDGSTRKSAFCIVKGKRDDNGEKFELVTSAVRIVRHFQNSKPESFPQHIEFYAESAEQMRERGAAADTNPMWLVRRLAPPTERRGAVPF